METSSFVFAHFFYGLVSAILFLCGFLTLAAVVFGRLTGNKVFFWIVASVILLSTGIITAFFAMEEIEQLEIAGQNSHNSIQERSTCLPSKQTKVGSCGNKPAQNGPSISIFRCPKIPTC